MKIKRTLASIIIAAVISLGIAIPITSAASMKNSSAASANKIANTNKSKKPVKPKTDQTREGATAECNDGTYSYSANHRGTCSHHGGVKRWFK